MADNMDLQISITGQNDTGSSFNSLDSAMSELQKLAEDVSKSFSDFARTLSSSFSDAGRSVEEMTRPLASLGSDAARVDELARSVGEVGTQAHEATRQLENMNQAASHSSGSGGGHGASGHNEGIFSMQGQMDSMYGGMAMGAAALPLVGAIKASTDAYGQFSQAMANVNSMMGLTQPQLAKISDQVLALSKNVPDGPVALANALYGIVGAGVPAADQMAVLTTASKAATAGQTDVSTATNALIAVMNSYGLKGKDVAKISDQMFAANAAGAMTFDSFARSIGNVAGPAAQAGVSFKEIGAATAALTNQGMSAQRATQGLRALLIGIMSPTAGATKEAKKLGIEWDQNALKSKGMANMLKEAMTATHGNSQELKKLIPNIAAWTVAVDLGGKGADSFKQAMQTMAGSAGATDKAMEQQKKGFQEQMNEMKNSIQSAEIAFAKGFIPVLTDVAGKLAKVAEWFSNLSPSTQKLIGEITLGAAVFLTLGSAFFMTISGIGAMIQGFSAIGSAVSGGITAMKEFATAVRTVGLAEAFMDAMNPVGWVILIGTVLVAIGVLVYQHWGQIKTFLQQTWNAISSAMSTAWNAIVNFFSNTWQNIKETASNVWNSISSFFSGLWNNISQTASSIWNGLINGIKSIWNGAISWIKGAAQTFVNIPVTAFQWLYNHNYYFKDLVDFIKKAWNTIKSDAETMWNTVKSWVTNLWNGIINTGKTVWNGLVNILSTVWNAIKSVAESFWNREKQGFENIWNAIVSVAKTVWNALTSFFSGLWHTISSGVSSAWNGIKSTIGSLANSAVNTLKTPFNTLGSFFSGLWSQAYQWGSNLVNMVANGIKSAAGAVTNAVKGVASSISSFLGFHSPAKEGPGSDADQWMPNLMNMFTTDIQKHTPQFQAAIGNVALGLKTGFTQAAPSGGNTGGGPTIVVYASGNVTRNERELGDIVSNAILNKVKMQGKI